MSSFFTIFSLRNFSLANIIMVAIFLSACAPMRSEQRPQTELAILEGMKRVAEEAVIYGDYSTAANVYLSLIKDFPEDKSIKLALGDVFSNMQIYDRAAEIYRDILRQENNPIALRGLAKASLALGRLNDATRMYLRLMELYPRDYKIINGLGAVFHSKEDYEKAIGLFKLGLKIEPNDISMLHNLAMSLAFSGELKKATRILEKISFAPDSNSDIRRNLALVYVMQGRLKTAEKVSRIDMSETDARISVKLLARDWALSMANIRLR